MDQAIYRCGDCELDAGNRCFTGGGQEVLLEPKVFAVLVQLLTHAGNLLTREQLLDAVWGHRFVTASTLNRVIALARRAFGGEPDGAQFIQTVYGAGYRYAGPIERAVPAPEARRARFGPSISTRLPARLSRLIGREQELRHIDELLAESRALTILGTGGMGKTQCAIAYAHGQTAHFPDGVWFFDLVALRQPGEWVQALALSLRIAPSGGRRLLAKIAEYLDGRRALLLLDNCDRICVGVGALVFELLQSTDQLKILATSQQALKFVGERVLRLPPLRLAARASPYGPAELAEVAATPAVSLLLARIHDYQPDFRLDERNAPVVIDICRRLDGMPLALELAAARFELLSAEQVLERIDKRFNFLVSAQTGRDHRHRNLITLLEWSYSLLSAEEQQFLGWLSVFSQGWTVDAAIDMACAFGATPEAVVDLLTGLAGKSLVAVDQSISPPRYRLLETVREFALEQLKFLGDEQRARDAHLGHIVRLSEASHRDILGGHMRERIALLAHEHANIEAAIEHAIGGANDRTAALQIAGSLTLYFKGHGTLIFGHRLCQRALSGAPPARTRARAQALMCSGILGHFMHKETVQAELTEAAAIAREVGDDWTEAYASGSLAMRLVHVGQASEISAHLAAVERIAARLNDEILRGLAGCIRGWAYLANDQDEQAILAMQPVRHLGSDISQRSFIGGYIGFALFRLGDYAGSARCCHETMFIALSVDHIRGVAASIEVCAYILERQGAPQPACRMLGAAEAIRQRLEAPLFIFWVALNEQVNTALRSTLGTEHYSSAKAAGAHMRVEDAVNEAAALLLEIGTGRPVN